MYVNRSDMELRKTIIGNHKLIVTGRYFYLFTLALWLFIQSCSSIGYLKKPPAADPVLIFQEKINEILQDSVLYQAHTGIKIVSLDRNEVLYEKNSHKLFHPASNMKIITTAAALKKLGVNFKFKTEVLVDTPGIADGKIAGNLYLKGGGDPDLTSDDLRKMIQNLKEQGITEIEGDLICDERYFDELFLGSGWMWDDASCWECAAISALSVNDNCVEVHLQPAPVIGEKPIVTICPATNYVKIDNQGITVDSLDTLQQQKFKIEREWIHPSNVIHIEGGIANNIPEVIQVIDIREPALYTGTLFRELLTDADIKFSGTVKKGVTSTNAISLITYWSKPLSLIVYNTNKESDNLSAELILKTMGAEKKNPPGTSRKGITVINEYLHEIGQDSSRFRLADGSGVSRYNLVSPELLVAILKDMYHDSKVQAEFKSSLPIAALDGTLKKRMKDSPAAGNLRAKTGSLSDVSTLSGYATSADGENLAFSLMMIHFNVPTSYIRMVQDKIGEAISSFHRNLSKSK